MKTGSVFWSVMTSVCYFYMVSAWGGYVIVYMHTLYAFVEVIFHTMRIRPWRTSYSNFHNDLIGLESDSTRADFLLKIW